MGGAIVPAYNKPGCDLKIKQTQLADIYLGKITDWKELGCEEGKISPVFRSDGSGTTAGFTNSLAAFSPEWKEKIGTANAVSWPVCVGSKGNAGVAGSIRTTLGSIGYVNQSYVKGEIRAATLQNKNGDFVAPTVESGALALNGITLDENLAGTDPNPAAEGAYPIATLTWILAYETGNGNKTEAIKTTLSTLLSDNYQEKASVLGYVPLRGDILQKSRDAVERIGK